MPTNKSPKSNNASAGMTYAQLSSRLDDLLARLQNPDVDIDEAVTLYQDTLACIAQIETHVATAKNQVTKIQADFNRNAQLEPADEI